MLPAIHYQVEVCVNALLDILEMHLSPTIISLVVPHVHMEIGVFLGMEIHVSRSVVLLQTIQEAEILVNVLLDTMEI